MPPECPAPAPAPAPALNPRSCFTIKPKVETTKQAELERKVIEILERQLLRKNIMLLLKNKQDASPRMFIELSFSNIGAIADNLVAAVMDSNIGFPSDFGYPINDGQKAFLKTMFGDVSLKYARSRYGNDNQRQQETRPVLPRSLG